MTWIVGAMQFQESHLCRWVHCGEGEGVLFREGHVGPRLPGALGRFQRRRALVDAGLAAQRPRVQVAGRAAEQDGLPGGGDVERCDLVALRLQLRSNAAFSGTNVLSVTRMQASLNHTFGTEHSHCHLADETFSTPILSTCH